MKVKVKWLLTGLAVAVIAVLVAGYAVLANLDVEQYRDEIQARAKAATGRDLVLDGPIDLRVSLTPAITATGVRFGNADWGSEPDMLRLRRFELEVALLPLLSRQYQVKRLVLIEPDVLLETGPEGQGNWELAPGEPGSDGVGDLPALEIDSVAVEGGRLRYRDAASGVSHDIALQSLRATGGEARPLDLALSGELRGVAFGLEGQVGAPRLLRSGRPYPMTVTATLGGAEISLDGRIADPLNAKGIDLRVAAKGDSLSALDALAGDSLPPVGPYEVSLTLGQDGQAFTFEGFTAKLGNSDLAGSGRLLIGATPRLQGRFTAGLLDIDDLAGGGTAGEGGDSPFVFGPEPLPLDLLALANAEIALAARRVRLPGGFMLSDLDTTLVLRDGKLGVAPLVADFYDGRLEANLFADGGDSSVSTALTATGVDYGKLLRALRVDEQVAGKADLVLRIDSSGASLREIASRANGRWAFTGGAGRIDNGLLELLTAGLGDILGPLLGEEEDFNLRCIVQNFAIEDGVATSEAIVVDTSGFTLTGGGTIDLETEALNLNFETESHDASIASLAVPFGVGGTLASPSVTPDPLGTALEVAKTAGLYINPFVGIGVLVGENLLGRVSEDSNPCVAAIQQAASGGQATDGSAVERATEGAAEAVEDAVEGIGESLKSLFGD